MIKGIIGSVIGDIAGSSREHTPVKTPRFQLLTKQSTITDDTVLTMAVAEWMLDRSGVDVADSLKRWGEEYPHAGYGSSFKSFLEMGPGGMSTHNGAAMRVSSVGFLASSIEECMDLAAQSAMPSHGSEQAVRAAQAVATTIFLARTGKSKNEIREFIENAFWYDLHRPYNLVREEVHAARAMREVDYRTSHERIVGAEPATQDALIAFLTGNSYEEVVRLAIYMGGDADTEAAIAGGMAAAYYGVPEEIVREALVYIPSDMLKVINAVDGTDWRPTGLIPPRSDRWSRHEVVIYGGCSYDADIFEKAGHLTRKSRFHRHYNHGYAIGVDRPIEDVIAEIEVLKLKHEAYPHLRWHLHEVGLEMGGWTVEQFRELFSWALDHENILVTPTLKEM